MYCLKVHIYTMISTLGELKKTGYQPKTVKQELRENLIKLLRKGEDGFKGIVGFEHSVIPELHTAILSQHNILLLGLRGQAKTRIARLLVQLLDEYVPVVQGSELNDDPLQPISVYAKNLIAELGDETPITWWHREERYTEKLATPDVSVADLIGDIDPIKAANLKLTYGDERAIHFGLIPRAHRGIFVINELPDLQARIQVALFNILQEKDIQIRGFKVRLPLDVSFVFTANPEDYTNRGSIVTPLKDRIESQILTHYPKTIEISEKITQQEAQLAAEQTQNIQNHALVARLIEHIAFEARKSEFVDAKSGVSARLTIAAYENLHSAAERRMLLAKENQTQVRITDCIGIMPAITGKIELVYEGEQEGNAKVAQTLIEKAIRNVFLELFVDPEKVKKSKDKSVSNPYQKVVDWFNKGNSVDLLQAATNHDYEKVLLGVPGLDDVVKTFYPYLPKQEKLLYMELVLHGLASRSLIGKHILAMGTQFKDTLSSLMNFSFDTEDEDR